jgi:hypothetical protein
VRSILIDPKLRRIIDVELPDRDPAMLIEMRRLIGCKSMDHTTISDRHDTIWVSDSGLQQRTCWAFKIRNSDPFAGTAIIIGADRHGNTRPPSIPIEWLENDVGWLDEIEPEIHWEESPIALPNGAIVTRVRSFVTYKRVRR